MEIGTRLILMVVIFIAATLASGAGTGGGALFIPGYVVSLGDVHRAVPLSKATIFGGCLISVLINIRRRHPKSGAPIINYELAAIMEPFTLLGAIIGVLLNIVMTDIQILICLVLTLSFTSYKTFKKGLAQRAEETRVLQQLEETKHLRETEDPVDITASTWGPLGDSRSELQQLLPQETKTEGGPPPSPVPLSKPAPHSSVLLLPLPGPPGGPPPPVSDGGAPGAPSSEPEETVSLKLKTVEETEDTTFFSSSEHMFGLPVGAASRGDIEKAFYCNTCQVSVLYLASDSLLNVILLLLAGGPVAVLCGTQLQQLCIYTLLSIHVLGTFLFARWLIKRRRLMEEVIKNSSNSSNSSSSNSSSSSSSSSIRGLDEGGLGWLNPITAFVYPLLSMIAGVLAGSIGIGGGLIKGPLLLEIGLSPLSAVSTANFMIFFTSSANTLQYSILGRLKTTDTLCFFSTAFIAGAVGLGFIYRLMKKTHRQSYLTFLLAFVSFISLASMVGSYIHTHYIMEGTEGGGARAPLTVGDACRLHQQGGRLLFAHI